MLTATGAFISVTFAQLHFRKPFLLAPEFTWSMSSCTFGENFHYYVYVMHKGRRKDEEQPVPFGWPVRASGAAPSGITDASMQHDHMDQEDFLCHLDL